MKRDWQGAGAYGLQLVRVSANLVCTLLFAAVFVIFLYKIVMRYAFGHAVAWGDEVTIVFFIWIIFLANSFLVPDRRQIAFDLVDRNLSASGRRLAAFVRLTLIGAILVWSLPGALSYIQFLWRERTPVLQWRLDFVYSCFGIYLVATILRIGYRLVALSRADWRDAL